MYNKLDLFHKYIDYNQDDIVLALADQLRHSSLVLKNGNSNLLSIMVPNKQSVSRIWARKIYRWWFGFRF
jgi:hypothetical protein